MKITIHYDDLSEIYDVLDDIEDSIIECEHLYTDVKKLLKVYNRLSTLKYIIENRIKINS